MTKYRVLFVVVLSAAAMLAAARAVALADGGRFRCAPALLDGLYVLSATGWGIVPGTTPDPSAPLPPKAIIELIRFNGDGTLVSPASTRSVNGSVVSSTSSTGIYTIDDVDQSGGGCSGTITFTEGPRWAFFTSVFAAGELWVILTNDKNVFRGNVTKIAR